MKTKIDKCGNVNSIFQLAEDEFFDGKHSLALELFERYLSIGGEREIEAKVFISMCSLHLRLAEYGLEVLQGLTLVESDDRFQAARLRAQHHKLLGEPDSATDFFREAIECKPGEVIGYIYLGSHFIDLGRYDDAVEVLKQGLKCSGEMDELHLNLALALRAKRRYDDALVHLNQAIEIDPEYRSAKLLKTDVENTIRVLKL